LAKNKRQLIVIVIAEIPNQLAKSINYFA